MPEGRETKPGSRDDSNLSSLSLSKVGTLRSHGGSYEHKPRVQVLPKAGLRERAIDRAMGPPNRLLTMTLRQALPRLKNLPLRNLHWVHPLARHRLWGGYHVSSAARQGQSYSKLPGLLPALPAASQHLQLPRHFPHCHLRRHHQADSA